MRHPVILRLLLAFSALLATAGITTSANAVSVTIDPGAYPHRYAVDNSGVPLTGPQTLDLATGTHTLFVGVQNAGTFSVDSAGNVTSNNPAAFSGGANSLTFNTATITFDPANYANNTNAAWAVHFVTTLAPKQIDTVTLVTGVEYRLNLGPLTGGTFLLFAVDSNGDVSPANSASATGGPGSLELKTATVSFDPGGYANNSNAAWAVHFVDVLEPKQIATAELVPEATAYRLNLGPLTGGPFALFTLGANGDITITNGAAASTGPFSLALQTVPITFDPGGYANNTGANWAVRFIDVLEAKQVATADLVPGVGGYTLNLGVLTGGSLITFELDGNGDPTITNGATVSVGPRSMTLQTQTMFVDPGSFAGNWEVRFIDRHTGAEKSDLVPGTGYVMAADGAIGTFTLDAPCSPSPDVLTLNSATLTLSCAPPSLSLVADTDSFISQTRKNRNFGGANELEATGNARERVVLAFDAQAIADFGTVGTATLRLTISQPPSSWAGGATLNAVPLGETFVQGNGNGITGTGAGVTWNCATDSNIADNQPNCAVRWNGGSPGNGTAAGQALANGQSGVVEWDVTADIQAGVSRWLLWAPSAPQNAAVTFASSEGAPDDASRPTLILE